MWSSPSSALFSIICDRRPAHPSIGAGRRKFCHPKGCALRASKSSAAQVVAMAAYGNPLTFSCLYVRLALTKGLCLVFFFV